MKAYRIISIITLFLPMTVLLLFFYFTSNEGVQELIESPKISFPNADRRYDYIIDQNDYWSINPIDKTISFHAEEMIFKEIKIYNGTVTIEYPFIFTMGNKFYTIEDDQVVLFNTAKLIKEKAFENSFLIGLSIFISLGTGCAIALMVFKKMQWLNRHRRLSVVISSWTFTIFFLIISLISTQVYLIFLVFSGSFTAYYIEWLIQRKKNGLPLTDFVAQRVVITNE